LQYNLEQLILIILISRDNFYTIEHKVGPKIVAAQDSITRIGSKVVLSGCNTPSLKITIIALVIVSENTTEDVVTSAGKATRLKQVFKDMLIRFNTLK